MEATGASTEVTYCKQSTVVVDATYTIVEVSVVNIPAGEIEITKTRDHDTDPLDKDSVVAGFILIYKDDDENYWFVSGSNESTENKTYNTSDYDVYYSTSDGNPLTIYNLKSGTYYIFEVEVQAGYYLCDQDGYMEYPDSSVYDMIPDEYSEWVYCGEVKVEPGKTSKEAYTNVTGKLTFEKWGNDDENTPLSKITFILIYDESSGNSGGSGYSFVSGDADGAKTYGSSIEEYSTSNGTITIDYLKEGHYYIFEVDVSWSSGNYYYLADQDGYMEDPTGMMSSTTYNESGWVYCGYMEVTAGKTTDEFTDYSSGNGTYINNLESGRLEINKKDADGEDVQINADFVLVYYDEYDETYKFVYGDAELTSPKDYGDNYTKYSTETATSIDDQIATCTTIYGLRIGTYYIFEVGISPAGYLLEYQDGYDEDPTGLMSRDIFEDGWVYCGSVEVITDTNDTNTTGATTTIDNVRAITITGYVWEDLGTNKETAWNSVYDDDETKIAKVNVYLKLKAGKLENLDEEITETWSTGNYTPNEKYSTQTDSETGTYTFENTILYRMLPYYYIEFDYTSGKSIDDGENLETWYINKNTSYIDDNDTKMYLRSSKDDEDAEGYSPYIAVAYWSEVDDATGSKAMMDEVDTYDGNLDGTATTYTGTTDEETYGLSGEIYDDCYNSTNATLSNINLGIKELYDPEYTIAEDLLYVKIEINGYTYLYEYGYTDAVETDEDGNPTDVTVPTVSFQDDEDTTLYTRYMYPSDLKEGLSSNGTLKVWLVYGITITNTTTYDVTERYSETNLVITNLTMSFNTTTDVTRETKNRLSLDNTSNTKDDDSEYDQEIFCNDTFSQWSDNGDGTATYNFDTENNENVVGGGEDTTIFIQFQVTDAGLIEILKKGTDTATEEYVTTASALGYHNYTRYDYSWKNNITATQSHTTDLKYKSHSAGYMVFQLGDDRTLSGTVFEDTVDSSRNSSTGEVVGNGIYDSGENTVGNVTVELLNYSTSYPSGTSATKYEFDTESLESTTSTIASITTTENGEFTFEGFIPGQYYLKFTYSDGTTATYTYDSSTDTYTECDISSNNEYIPTTYIYDSSTGEYIPTTYIYDSSATGDKYTTICINDYKSTIVTSDSVKDAIIAETKRASDGVTSDDGLWYRDYDNNNNTYYSTATDNLSLRETYNNNLVYTYTSSDGSITNTTATSSIDYMEANTPMFEITIENTDDTSSEEGTSEGLHEGVYEGFNFGIITQPEQSVEVEKTITNVELTNTPVTIIDGNPATDSLTGTTSLKDYTDRATNKGSTYVRVEIEEDYIYGSTLTVTYTITITNTSDLNYYEYKSDYYGWYYMFGEYDTSSYSTQVELTLDSVLDGNDPDLEWIIDGTGAETATVTLTSYPNTITRSNAKGENTTLTKITEKSSTTPDSEGNTITTYEWQDESGGSYTVKDTPKELMEANAQNRSGQNKKTYDYEELIYSSSWGSVVISESLYMTVSFSKTLSNADTDMAYINEAEVNELHVTTISELNISDSTGDSSVLVKRPKIPNPSNSYITISEPTGDDKISVVFYVSSAILGLIILSVGVVVIKKKIFLDK